MAKKTDAKLHTVITQDWIQEALRSSKIGFWRILIEPTTGINQLYVDESMIQSMEYPPNQSPEENFIFWISRIPEVELSYVQKAITELFENPEEVFELEYSWTHPTLGIVPLRAGGKVFTPVRPNYRGIEGHQIVLHGVGNLESSLRRSSLNMEAMFNATPVGIGIWDTQFNFLDCNPKMLDLLGVKDKDALGQQLHVFSSNQSCGTEGTALITEHFLQARVKGVVSFEWVFGGNEDAVVTCEVTVTFTSAQDQKVFMVFLRDLSNEKKIIKKLSERQAELHKALTLADEARHTKNMFFANISHEIRTPMNAIMGMSYLCLQHTNDSTIRHYLENIRKAGESLLNIINDVLDISKIEAGKLELDHAPFNFAELLEGISGTVSSLVSDKPIELLFNIDPRLPSIFVGDAVRLGQVITNLLSNAIKFTQQGYIVLRVSIKSMKGALCTLGIEVTDTGIGMDKERLEAIFQPFEQAEHTTSRRFGGTGLGLAISKNIVEKMGGTVNVHSEEGVGTVFSFEVSLLHRREESWIDSDFAHKEKILIVDDSPMACLVLKEMLEICGFTVDTIDDCHKACELVLQAIKVQPYSLVIIDWKMPHMSGHDCAEKIKSLSLHPAPALVLTSAYSSYAFNQKWTDLFSAFISKPVLPMPLWAAVMKALRGVEPQTHTKVENTHVEKTKKLAGRRVLLTEDNEINQEIAMALLEDLGMKIDLAENGQEAVTLCKKNFYDVVLMDIQMPIMDGLTATRHIRDLQGYGKNQIPIIAMTAHAMQMHKEQSFNAGMNDHITKPIEPNVLREVLCKWVLKE